jgi:N-acyl-L-homoserine lactone synthetase
MNNSVLTEEIARTAHQFTIEMVNSPEQLREVFRLRHQVYCVERGYEPGDDGEEVDEFDGRSKHVLLRHTADGEVVGTVRVIAPDRGNLGDSFPMQRLCDPQLLSHLPLPTTGEVSRFALSKLRRMSCPDVMLLRLALVRGLVQLSSEMGITNWMAVMERSLLRLNERNAIFFDRIGPVVSYHGIRQPAVTELASMLAHVRAEQFPTWEFLTANGEWFSERPRALEAA